MKKDRESQEPSGTEKTGVSGSTQVTEITLPLIEALGGKLNELGRSLSDDEQVVLATAFTLAARSFSTFCGAEACVGDVRVGLGRNSVSVERRSGSSVPKLSETLESVFCPGKAGRFSIEGMEVDRTMFGAKSVAAGAKSVAAGFCRTPGMVGAKSVAAGACRFPGMAGAKSVAAGAYCRFPGFAGAKSVAACSNPGMFGTQFMCGSYCRG